MTTPIASPNSKSLRRLSMCALWHITQGYGQAAGDRISGIFFVTFVLPLFD